MYRLYRPCTTLTSVTPAGCVARAGWTPNVSNLAHELQRGKAALVPAPPAERIYHLGRYHCLVPSLYRFLYHGCTALSLCRTHPLGDCPNRRCDTQGYRTGAALYEWYTGTIKKEYFNYTLPPYTSWIARCPNNERPLRVAESMTLNDNLKCY